MYHQTDMEKQNQKHYLFYQKQSLPFFWKNCMRIEKFYLISWGLFALFMAILFICCNFYSTDPVTSALLFGSSWLFLFPGTLFICHMISKSYWVIFREQNMLRHGNYENFGQNKIVSYEEVAYIQIGNVPPLLTPRATNTSNWYHKKFGNYINVLASNKTCLVTVRYSEDIFKLLTEKCIHAQLISAAYQEENL